MSEGIEKKLPWWTWVLPILLLHLGTETSLFFKYKEGVSDVYLPTAFSIVMIYWWGPLRIIPAMYLNAVLSTGLWGIEDFRQWPLYGTPETIFTITSWLLFIKLNRGQYWMPDLKNLANFIMLGMIVPILIEVALLEGLLIYFKEQKLEDFVTIFTRNSLGEYSSCFSFTLLLLYYATPYLQRAGLLINPPTEILRLPRLSPRSRRTEIFFIIIIILTFSFFVPFQKFWFVYGLFSMYSALRFGFGPAIITNYAIFIITYFIPQIFKLPTVADMSDENAINIFLGMSLLYGFAAIAGRVLSDLRKVEIKLQKKNNELHQTNNELDRFVYSVSHDLSAPLKSIRGLVKVSRIDKAEAPENYLDKIEASAHRLEDFISEILDYSRNNRLWQKPEPINLKELCAELINNLRYIDGFKNIRIDLDSIEPRNIMVDKMRLKIILNNLLSNAIKFHRKSGDDLFIKVSAVQKLNTIIIEVADNGQGISQGYQHRIFEMFFRANETAKGSGLGLYIAKEAVQKIGGTIHLQSEYGKGSTFTVEIPLIPLKN